MPPFAKPRSKRNRTNISDVRGLYLLVNSSGKYFRMNYRFGGKQKTLALGVYPEVSLKEAREQRDEARKRIRNDIDPQELKKAAQTAQVEAVTHSFEAVVLEWFTKNTDVWTQGHARTIIRRLELNVFPWLGARPIASIKAPDLLAVLRRVEERGARETAHRVKQICGQVYRYAIATGRAEIDPGAGLHGALAPAKSKRMATITDPQKIGALLWAMDGYEGRLITRCALRLAPLVFVRPGELYS
nr:integrase arm-type DNA-binding domain-containing protein [Desulfoluna limicola]